MPPAGGVRGRGRGSMGVSTVGRPPRRPPPPSGAFEERPHPAPAPPLSIFVLVGGRSGRVAARGETR